MNEQIGRNSQVLTIDSLELLKIVNLGRLDQPQRYKKIVTWGYLDLLNVFESGTDFYMLQEVEYIPFVMQHLFGKEIAPSNNITITKNDYVKGMSILKKKGIYFPKVGYGEAEYYEEIAKIKVRKKVYNINDNISITFFKNKKYKNIFSLPYVINPVIYELMYKNKLIQCNALSNFTDRYMEKYKQVLLTQVNGVIDNKTVDGVYFVPYTAMILLLRIEGLI